MPPPTKREIPQHIRIISGALFILFTIASVFTLLSAQRGQEKRLRDPAGTFYYFMSLGLKGHYAYFKTEEPTWVKAVWWLSMCAQDGGVVDAVGSVVTAYHSCQNSPLVPSGGDCWQDATIAVKQVVGNIGVLSIGWYAPAHIAWLLTDAQPSVKRDLANYRR